MARSLLLLLVLPSLAWAYSPAPPACAPDAEANDAHLQAALAKARAIFPEAKDVEGCVLFARTKQVRLEPIKLTEGSVQLEVQPMVIDSGSGWQLVPFADRAAVKRVLGRITSEPVVKRAMKKGLHCVAATDAPGATAWFRCGTAPLDDPSTPSSGHLSGRVTEFEFASYGAPPKSCDCAEFPLVNYSMPFELLPEDAPGWCTVKGTPEVQAFVKAHRVEHVTVARWHEYTVKLRAADGATHEAPLKAGQCYCSTMPACSK